MKTVHKKRMVLSAVALSAAMILAACGGGGDDNDKKDAGASSLNSMSPEELAKAGAGEEVFWLTTSYPTETAQEVADAFMAKYPDIKVKVDRKTANENWSQLQTAMAAKAAKADVYSSTQPQFYDMAKEAGFLECYLPPTTDDLGDDYKGDDCWFSIRQSVFPLVYNTDKVSAEEAPKTYEDLADPKWKGKVGLLDPALSNNAFSAYYTVSQALSNGDFKSTSDYWKALGKNKPVLYAQGGAMINALASGEVSVGWNFGYRAWQFEDDGAPVAISMPDLGVVSNQDYTMLIADNDAPHASRLFMNFLASKEAMGIGTKSAYYYSVRNDVPVYPEGRPSLDDLKLLPPDWNQQDKDHDEFLKMWEADVKK